MAYSYSQSYIYILVYIYIYIYIGISESASPKNSLSGKQNGSLLSLAGEISSHVNVSDLAKCLEISLDDAKFNASDTKRDKIFTLFLLWQSANSALPENSMATLLTRLREQLKNVPVNIIKKYGKSNHNID